MVEVHGLRIDVSGGIHLRPDGNRAYQRLSGKGVKNITSKGTVRDALAEGGGGLGGLADDLAAKAAHTLLLLSAGLADIAPAAEVLSEHHQPFGWGPTKLVFLVALGDDKPEAVLQLKDLVVRGLRGFTEVVGISSRDIVLATPQQARKQGLGFVAA
jgi:hypothetical protein